MKKRFAKKELVLVLINWGSLKIKELQKIIFIGEKNIIYGTEEGCKKIYLKMIFREAIHYQIVK